MILFVLLLSAFALVPGINATCPLIIGREKWGAEPPSRIKYLIFPVKYVMVHHTDTPICKTLLQCKQAVQNIQNYHMDYLSFDDIGYSFLIGADGYVYEGRGWHKVGSHSQNFDDVSIGIAFIGNYEKNSPTAMQLNSAQRLLECGVQQGKLSSNYKLLGLRQVSTATTSPGENVYEEIRTWDHWVSSP